MLDQWVFGIRARARTADRLGANRIAKDWTFQRRKYGFLHRDLVKTYRRAVLVKRSRFLRFEQLKSKYILRFTSSEKYVTHGKCLSTRLKRRLYDCGEGTNTRTPIMISDRHFVSLWLLTKNASKTNHVKWLINRYCTITLLNRNVIDSDVLLGYCAVRCKKYFAASSIPLPLARSFVTRENCG